MIKKKVLLLFTPVEQENRAQGVIDESGKFEYPVGLSYLDAILEKNGYEVSIKSYMFWRENIFLMQLEKVLQEFQPDFVGISVLTMTRVSTYKAIKLIKNFNPNIKILLGGMHASIMYKQLLENFQVDAVCVGEAEESLPELLEALIKNKGLEKIKGIAFKKNKEVIYTGLRKINMDLNKYPFPKLDKFMKKNNTVLKVVSSRGCPNKCSFCCLDIVSRRIWRPRDPKNVVDEIELALNKYPWIETIEFSDDTITLDNHRMIELCKELIKRGIKKKIQCQGRIKPVSKEMFEWMEKVGVVKIAFGIETGSEKLLKSIHKGITPQECIDTFNILKNYKIQPVKLLIVGLPGEDENTVNETIKFSKTLQKIIKMDFFTATPLIIYPGTEVYEIAKQKGIIDDNFWLTDKICPLYTAEHSEEWLRKMANKIALDCAFAQGKIYFLRRAFEKMISNPKYYLKRIRQGL